MDKSIIIVLVIFFIYIIYNESQKNSLKESMASLSANVDYEAIKNLGIIAKGLTKGGYKVPGDLIIDG